MQAHVQKLKKWKEQREALSEQIRLKTQLDDDSSKEKLMENPHARSESLMVLYKREKAKQLYEEQIQILKKKREFESKVAEIDRQHSIERLVAARKE
jgi:hypothetical protein